MEVATGASASLLIYILVLIGPSAANAAPAVIDAVVRTNDERIRYRAYQFACAHRGTLLRRVMRRNASGGKSRPSEAAWPDGNRWLFAFAIAATLFALDSGRRSRSD